MIKKFGNFLSPPMQELKIEIFINERKYKIEKNRKISSIIKQYVKEAKKALVAEIDGILVDLSTLIAKECRITLYDFESEKGKSVFWHSSAHILGNALVNIYGCKLVNGPPISEGFYYDVYTENPISTDDFEKIKNEMKKIVKLNQKFERIEMDKEDLLRYYENNKFKKYFIEKKVDSNSTTVYRNGSFIDMCRGPHIPSTGFLKEIELIKTSSVYFLNNKKNESLQRIYCISFPEKKYMVEYNERKRREMEMDHRKIGKEMDLFFFHHYSPGSCFWLPDGAHIYNKLVDFLRDEYRTRGFKEVITPNLFSIDLWKESGHYDNYKENIYMVNDEDFGLKPMNCPGHCLMFRNKDRSFRELPLRFADFGVLHRNEVSGSLTGLTRVRRFQQDDAHIFCMKSQIESEISGCINFLKDVYGIFGFKYQLYLSTRPEKYMGELEDWDKAEEALQQSIEQEGLSYKINSGDGAFYGPKIDIILEDAFGRKIQCATIQLDFQLPLRFGLKYRTTDGISKTPVIIHRAIFGSLERFVSIVIEQFGKRLPFWLTPHQVAIIPVYPNKYSEYISNTLSEFETKTYDDQGLTFGKRIRNAETDGYRVICIIGKKEELSGTVSVRYKNSCINLLLADLISILKSVSGTRSDHELDMKFTVISSNKAEEKSN